MQEEKIEELGIDWDGPIPNEEWDGALEGVLEVPETATPGDNALLDQIDPLAESQYFGVDIYIEVLHILENTI